MAKALMSATSRIPCPRRAKCAGAVIIEALALLAMVVVMSGAAPTFLPSTTPIRSWQAEAQQGGRASHRRVLVGSRKVLEPRGHSRMPLLAVYNSMKVAELKDLCKERGLQVTGTKAVLISRLEEAEGTEDANGLENADGPKGTAKDEDADDPEEVDGSEEEIQLSSDTTILPGDRVMARYHRDNQMYPGIVLEQQDSETYLVSWDEPDEPEPLTSCKKVEFLKKAKQRLEPGNKQIYHVGDKITARFAKDNGWYEAQLLELKGDSCKIKWKDPDGFPPIEELKLNDIKLVLRVKSAC